MSATVLARTEAYAAHSPAITVGGAFLLFSGITVAAWVFTYRFLPGECTRRQDLIAQWLITSAVTETKGLTLEETRTLFEREKWWRDEEPGTSAARYQSVASEDVEPGVDEGVEHDGGAT